MLDTARYRPRSGMQRQQLTSCDVEWVVCKLRICVEGHVPAVNASKRARCHTRAVQAAKKPSRNLRLLAAVSASPVV